MMQVKGGFRSPEDIKKTILNPDPSSKQLAPNEHVDHIRRIQLNDLENLPFFLTAGFLFILTEPSIALARWLLYGYVVSRLLHFAAYFSRGTHDTRATLWTVGSLILIFIELLDALCCLASITRQLSAPLRMLTILKMCVQRDRSEAALVRPTPAREPQTIPRFRALVLGHSVDLGQRQRFFVRSRYTQPHLRRLSSPFQLRKHEDGGPPCTLEASFDQVSDSCRDRY